jgi:hypothetical protein
MKFNQNTTLRSPQNGRHPSRCCASGHDLRPAAWAIVTEETSGVIALDFDGPAGLKRLQVLRWCEEHSFKPAFRNTNWFSGNLMQRDGIDGRKGGKGKRLFLGITIKS